MSKTDLLTAGETEQATAEGWGLFRVFDLGPRKWRLMALYTNGNVNQDAGEYVVSRARMGHPICTKALQLIMQSNQGI